MEMRHQLPAMFALIEDQAIAFFQAKFLGDLFSYQQGIAQQFRVFGLAQVADVFLGHDKQVDRRLRRDVFDDDEILILVDGVGFQFSADDFAENILDHEINADARARPLRILCRTTATRTVFL